MKKNKLNSNYNFTNVSLIVNGKTCEINNGVISVKYNQEACIDFFKINGKNLTDNLHGNRSFYLDCNGGSYRFIPTELKVVEHNNNIAHVCYEQSSFHELYAEYHIIVTNDTAGIYTYIKIKNNTQKNIDISELRIVYRFDPTSMNKVYNGFTKGTLPLYKDLYKLPKIQDETWQLIDGTYYSKYDYAGYIKNTSYFGLHNNTNGVWIINNTHDYYSGGPLKQDLLVHQDSLMLNYLTSSHFGTPNTLIPSGWKKLYGPWLIYANEFNNENEMLIDLNNRVNIENNKNPYNWVNDTLYPLNRRILKGRIKDNIKATVIIHSSIQEDFEKQTLGYSYFTNTDENGYFHINNIRPNNYKLNIYPISGYNCEVLLTSTISLLNNDQDLGEFNLLPNEPNVLWSISQTNRKSSDFCYSDQKRNYIWQLLCNKQINFVVNKSNLQKDFFYAQTKLGSWNILFDDVNNQLDRVLRIGLAATSSSSISKSSIPHLQILFNESEIFNKTYTNDKTIYRSALNSGNFEYILLNINTNLIKSGNNTITLNLKGGAFMYDSISYSK